MKASAAVRENNLTIEKTNLLLHILIGAERGGCERNALQMVLHLKGASHRVLVLDRDGPMAPDLRAAGAVVDVLPRAEIRTNARLIARVREYARRHRPAAVMAWHGVWIPQLLHALRELPGVIGLHQGNPAYSWPWWADWKFEALGWWYPGGESVVQIYPSEYIAASFKGNRYLNRFPRRVILNPVEIPDRPPHTPRPLSPDQPVVIGMLARLDAIKDHATVVRALPALRRTYPLARIEFAGSGPHEPTLRRLVNDLRLQDAVEFVGQVADVYAAMAGWDLFAYATTTDEGFGIALAEAMVLGLPSVATDVGPIREVVGDPPAAVLVPPRDPAAMADALTKLLTDTAARRRLGEAGRARALGTFSPEIIAKQYADALQLTDGLPDDAIGTRRLINT